MQGTPRAIPVTWRFRDPLRSDIQAASPRHLPRNPGRGPPAGGTGSPRSKKSPTLTFSCWLPISLAHPLLCSALLGVVAGGSRAYPPRAERWRRPRRPWPSSAPTNSASSSTPPSSAPAPASAASSPRSVPAHLIAALPLFPHPHVASFLRDDQAWLIGDSGAGGPVGIGGARGAERGPPPVREPGGSRAR